MKTNITAWSLFNWKFNRNQSPRYFTFDMSIKLPCHFSLLTLLYSLSETSSLFLDLLSLYSISQTICDKSMRMKTEKSQTGKLESLKMCLFGSKSAIPQYYFLLICRNLNQHIVSLIGVEQNWPRICRSAFWRVSPRDLIRIQSAHKGPNFYLIMCKLALTFLENCQSASLFIKIAKSVNKSLCSFYFS